MEKCALGGYNKNELVLGHFFLFFFGWVLIWLIIFWNIIVELYSGQMGWLAKIIVNVTSKVVSLPDTYHADSEAIFRVKTSSLFAEAKGNKLTWHLVALKKKGFSVLRFLHVN